jgi:hypothetical protein
MGELTSGSQKTGTPLSKSAGKRLGQVEPRERVGSQTSRKYEYQYERTARAALDLLADGTGHTAVYCDWHDDYVIETGNPPTRYVFHQIKGRTSSQGPWKFREFFGVPMRSATSPTAKAPAVEPTAIVPLMLLHYGNFQDNCAGIAFVTNTGLEKALHKFLTSLQSCTKIADLPDDTCNAFNHLASAYANAAPPLASSPDRLFEQLRALTILTDQGRVDSANPNLLEIADVIVEFSEIDLTQRQSKQIARDIVDLVRGKVAHTATAIPTSDDQLRCDKGIVIEDVLARLSLSVRAFTALRSGTNSDLVRKLSRLQRFCLETGYDEHLESICEFKSKWDAWRTIERHSLAGSDYVLLVQRAHQVIQGKPTLSQVVADAKDIAKQFAHIGASPLSPEAVLGLIFSLAAQTESLSNRKAED